MKSRSLLTAIVALVVAGLALSSATGSNSPWIPGRVLVADTGSIVELADPISVGTSLVIPYYFEVGNLGFLASRDIREDGTTSKPRVVTPNGLLTAGVYSDPSSWPNPVQLKAASDSQGGRYFAWTIEDSTTDVDKIYVTKSWVGSENSEFEEDIGFETNLAFTLPNRGLTSFELSVTSQNEVVVVASAGGNLLAKVSSDGETWPEEPAVLANGEVNYEDNFSIYPSNPKMLVLNSGEVLVYWAYSESYWGDGDSTELIGEGIKPKYSIFRNESFSSGIELSGFNSAENLTATMRTDNLVTFSTANAGLMQIVDLNLTTGLVELPYFDFQLAGADEYSDEIFVIQGNKTDTLNVGWNRWSGESTWAEIDSQNLLRSLGTLKSSISMVKPSKSGRPLIVSYSEGFNKGFVFESGKFVNIFSTTESLNPFNFSWSPTGEIIGLFSPPADFITNDWSPQSLSFARLNRGAKPKLESPLKTSGTFKVGQTLSVSEPVWISYSKLENSRSISWVRCSKAVAKVTFSLPSGCSLIRNSTGSTYLLKVEDKKKYIAPYFSAENLQGLSITVLPATTAVK
jgi:hypothetical protein